MHIIDVFSYLHSKRIYDVLYFLDLTGTSFLKWEALPKCKTKHQTYVIPLRRTKTVQAVTSPVTAPLPADSAEERKELCESYGFRQIGEPLPDNITLKNIIDTLPKTVLDSYLLSFLCRLVE